MKDAMRDEQPLTDRDFAGIRRAVLESIEAQKVRRNRMLLSLQFAFGALVLVVGMWWMRRAEPPATLAAPQPLPRPFASLSATPSPLPEARETRPASHRPRHRHSAPKHETVLAAASDANPIRLELATADPDIRIIWISNPTDSR